MKIIFAKVNSWWLKTCGTNESIHKAHLQVMIHWKFQYTCPTHTKFKTRKIQAQTGHHLTKKNFFSTFLLPGVWWALPEHKLMGTTSNSEFFRPNCEAARENERKGKLNLFFSRRNFSVTPFLSVLPSVRPKKRPSKLLSSGSLL